ncbi:MAG: hypothetical protein UW03_C0032G0006 [Candidatus Peregrinibacteria bacterium GW2011_GWA2_43_8]|nr:MAG: hypothetical protein UW03_C0032G0006 [Candidatus Peregrinibacteria bacterium GW2011_GWA2_43_8]
MHAPVVQWIERQVADLEAAGSIPAGRTKKIFLKHETVVLLRRLRQHEKSRC